MKKYLIENHCKFSYDDEIGGLALDCKLSNENRLKAINHNHNSNQMNDKSSIIKRLGDTSRNSNNNCNSNNNHKRKVEIDVSNDISNQKKKHIHKHKKTKR